MVNNTDGCAIHYQVDSVIPQTSHSPTCGYHYIALAWMVLFSTTVFKFLVFLILVRPMHKFILLHWLNTRLYFVKNLHAIRGSFYGNQPNSTRNSKEQSCPYSCANNRNPSEPHSHQDYLKKMEFKLTNNLLVVNRKKLNPPTTFCNILQEI